MKSIVAVLLAAALAIGAVIWWAGRSADQVTSTLLALPDQASVAVARANISVRAPGPAGVRGRERRLRRRHGGRAAADQRLDRQPASRCTTCRRAPTACRARSAPQRSASPGQAARSSTRPALRPFEGQRLGRLHSRCRPAPGKASRLRRVIHGRSFTERSSDAIFEWRRRLSARWAGRRSLNCSS